MPQQRENWLRHVDDIIRSRRYTWIGEGLGGRGVPEAMSQIMTDVMHICDREGISLDELLAESRRRAESEAQTGGAAALN
jgi:hypothetical protein